MDFTKVTYDGDLSEFSDEELRELIREFEDAQDSNVAEFEQAAEQLEEANFDEYEEARSDLIGEITEAEQFDEVPLSEDELEDADFSELRDWNEFVSDQDDDKQFDDIGEDADLKDDNDGEFSQFDDDLTERVKNISGTVVPQ